MLWVLGTSGLAREMAQLWRVLNGADAEVMFAAKSDEDLIQAGSLAVLAVGESHARLRLYERGSSQWEFPTLVHPAADIGDSVVLGDGVVATSGVVATTDVDVGDGSLLNWNVTLGHDVIVGRCCVINPQAAISGGVRLGPGVLVGAGAVVLEGRQVGAGARVGAGAVVTHDVEPGATVVGNPARLLSRSNP